MGWSGDTWRKWRGMTGFMISEYCPEGRMRDQERRGRQRERAGNTSIGENMGVYPPYLLGFRDAYAILKDSADNNYRSMLYLPFSSIFYPILSLPTTLSRIFSPSQKLLSMYTASFTDGSQLRGLEKFKKEIEEGGPLKTVEKMQAFYKKKAEKIMEERETKQAHVAEARKAQNEAVATAEAARIEANQRNGRGNGTTSNVGTGRSQNRSDFDERLPRMGDKDVEGKQE
jgi:hypothetical protein